MIILKTIHEREQTHARTRTNDKKEPILIRACPCGVMVKVMDCRIVVSEFVLQSRYYVHYRANTLGKGMNPIIFPAVG